ncbi:unnamed protein product [Periconia digitata]|uniref:DUF7053 domain-containing protein n=1 Tax=Periconia digitata TaxID=1303443 RepID=A0A9W4UEC0_9PLEO|nr:unnamed protein product [Periconia digitata]
MFSFSTTANLHHVTPLSAGTAFSTAISKLHDHDLLMRLDPELAHYESLPSEADAPNTKRYKVTDHMHTLPKGLWDTTVTFESQMTNTENGIEWVIKAPLGLVQRTSWKLVKSSEVDGGGKGQAEAKEDEWCLVEDVEINASRLLVGTVKSKCEENWKGIHAKFVEHVRGGSAVAVGA